MATAHAEKYEQAFPPTAPGVIEIKELPASRWLVARSDESYHDRANGLFSQLFAYLRANEVKMTVPVQADMKPGAMRFHVGKSDAVRSLPDTDTVKVEEMPARTVASAGVRGGYTEKNFAEAESRLKTWLSARPQYEADGPAYGVFWNSPFVPWFVKRSEVHIPVRSVAGR